MNERPVAAHPYRRIKATINSGVGLLRGHIIGGTRGRVLRVCRWNKCMNNRSPRRGCDREINVRIPRDFHTYVTS